MKILFVEDDHIQLMTYKQIENVLDFFALMTGLFSQGKRGITAISDVTASNRTYIHAGNCNDGSSNIQEVSHEKDE